MRVHILCSSYKNPIKDPDRILRRIVRSYPIYSPVREDKIFARSYEDLEKKCMFISFVILTKILIGSFQDPTKILRKNACLYPA